MDDRITRRTLVAFAAALPAAGQGNPTAPLPSTPEEERKAISAQFRSNADALAKVKLPMSTEPATRFKA